MGLDIEEKSNPSSSSSLSTTQSIIKEAGVEVNSSSSMSIKYKYYKLLQESKERIVNWICEAITIPSKAHSNPNPSMMTTAKPALEALMILLRSNSLLESFDNHGGK